MHHVGYRFMSILPDDLGCRNRTSSSFLTADECFIEWGLTIYLLFFSALGFVLHSYIIVCYLLLKRGKFTSNQLLVVLLSIFDLLCFVSFYVTTFGALTNEIKIQCTLYIILLTVTQKSIYYVLLLLAANRYVAVCKPRVYLRYFSNAKIIFYFILIAFIAIFQSTFFPILQCTDKLGYPGVNFSVEENKRFLEFDMFTRTFVYLGILTVVVLLYMQVLHTLRLRAEAEQENVDRLNSLNIPGTTDELNYEKKYYRAFAIFVFVCVSLLMVDLIICITMDALALASPKYMKKKAVAIELIVILSFASVYGVIFLLNPVVFYITNEDFRSKVLTPINGCLSLCLPQKPKSVSQQAADSYLPHDLSVSVSGYGGGSSSFRERSSSIRNL